MYRPIFGLQIAFRNYTFSKGIFGSDWVGLRHFKTMLVDPLFLRAFRNTVVIALLKLVFVATSGLVLALLLHEIGNKIFRNLVQDFSMLPHFFSWVIIGSILVEMLSPSSGFVNIIRQKIGLEPIFFLAEKRWFLFWVIASDVWESAGWNGIIFIAAISGISPDLYEAASIDGAGRFRKIWHVTLPCILSTIFIVMVLKIGGIMNAGFDQMYNMYNPAVMSVADIIDTYTYRIGIQQFKFSYAAAVGLLKNLIGLALVLTTNHIAKRNKEEVLW
jgi:putative aldouronate transport system permease protein